MAGRNIVFDHGNASVGQVEIVAVRGGGREGLSEIYQYQVDIEVRGEGGLSDDAIDSLLTNPVRVAFGEAGDRDVHGIIRELEMLSTHTNAYTLYRLTIVPKLWFLTLTRRNRVWQEQSYLDIVKAVLEEHGLKIGTHVTDSCSGTYASVEYTVQHEETDFAFISRLMEHHGIHYHFQAQPDGEMLVLGDDNNAFEPVVDHATLQYSPLLAAGHGDDVCTSLRRFRRVLPAEIQVRDYNWRTPTTPLKVKAAVDKSTGHGLVDLYGDHFADANEGKEVARIRSEQMMVAHDTFLLETGSIELYPGATFELTGHPIPDLDQEYVVTRLLFDLQQDGDGALTNKIEAIPATVPFRPQRRAAWPKLDGLVSAKVDGESRSTMTPIDPEGRYRLVITGDEMGKGGGKASRYVRRAQPSAGSGYGMHLPLHIGTECIVAHVNGDPDRPIIVGAVPNAETASPVVGPNATHSRIRTGSGVLIEMDDDC
jgi:type VI secretion system secreted protein VgrG